MPSKYVNIIEIFIDNFIDAKNNAKVTHFLHLLYYMLHVIHAIILPFETTQRGLGNSVS